MYKDHISTIKLSIWKASSPWLQGVHQEEHDVLLLWKDEQHNSCQYYITDSKVPWIDVDKIWIQCEGVRSMSNQYWFDGPCYLANSIETIKVDHRSYFEVTRDTPYGQAMGWLCEYLWEINCSPTRWEMALLIPSGCLQLSTLTASSFPRQMLMVGQGLPMYHSWLTLWQHTDHCGDEISLYLAPYCLEQWNVTDGPSKCFFGFNLINISVAFFKRKSNWQ